MNLLSREDAEAGGVGCALMVVSVPFLLAGGLVHDATGWNLWVSGIVGTIAWLILWGALKGIGRGLVAGVDALEDRARVRAAQRETERARIAESEAIVEEWRRRRGSP